MSDTELNGLACAMALCPRLFYLNHDEYGIAAEYTANSDITRFGAKRKPCTEISSSKKSQS
jgi:hypothetical protein